MRKRSWVVLLALSICGCNSEKIVRLEKENRELAAKLDATMKAATLDGQERCAKQALRQFQTQRYDKDKLVGFTNHYSLKLNKCFMEIQDNSGSHERGKYVPTVYRTVSDAFEGKTHAEYFWRNAEGKKYWEVAPALCKVTNLSGEETFCKSAEEYEQLIKQYMEQ